MTREEWLAAPAEGQNPVGFTAWHVSSIQDWAICTWLRDIESVRSRPQWVAKGMSATFLPIGMGLDAAHEIARAARPEDVLAYADAVLVEAAEMLAGFTPARFDELPPNREDFRDDRYSAPGYIADLDGMFEQPYWRVFAGACTGHCRGHIGELELALAVIRAG